MASFRKFFPNYKKRPDGLLEICRRVYVLDCCFSTHILEGDDYKVYMEGIVVRMQQNFPDASFMIFNFHEGQSESQITNILSQHNMNIMDYPCNYGICPLLKMEMIHHFLRSCESWLSSGEHNHLMLYCEGGGLLILAFMLAALMIYLKQHTSEQKTLEMIYKQAPGELLRLLSPLNPMPSHLRYLRYVSISGASEWLLLDRALMLECIILHMIPKFEGGCRPIFHIYGQDPFFPSNHTTKELISASKKSKSVKQVDCELVEFNIHCHIQGDLVLECNSLDKDLKQQKLIFRIMFNTAFVGSNSLVLNREEIDILWDAEDWFPNNFGVEVILSGEDAAMGMPSAKEEKGLPVHMCQDVTSSDASGENLEILSQQSIQFDNVLQLSTFQYGEANTHSISKRSEVKVASASPSSISMPAISWLHETTEDILTPALSQQLQLLELPFSASSSQDILVIPSPYPSSPASSASTLITDCTPPPSVTPPQLNPASSQLIQQPAVTAPILVIPETSSLSSLQPLPSTASESVTAPSPVPSFPDASLLSVSPSAKINSLTLEDPQPSDSTLIEPLSTLQSFPTISDILSVPCPTSLSIKKATGMEGVPPLSLSPSRPALTLPRVVPSATNPSLSCHLAPMQSSFSSSPGSLPLPPVAPPIQSSLRAMQTGKPSAPPPPPPGMGSLNQISSRRIPLRPFYWSKVTRAVKGSLWEEAKKFKVPEVDMSELESLFHAPPKVEGHRLLGGKSKKVHLIPFQRAQVYEMLLKRINIPIPDFMSSFLAFDDFLLGAKLEVDFTKLYPKEDEWKLLQGYRGDRESLGICEQFVLELMKIPEVKSKLRAFSFKIKFRSKVADIRNDLNIVSSAASEIRNSTKLKIIMLVILSLGNALNHGTSRGSAIGFRLDSLLKLIDTRASNRRMTLMHYLCKVLADKLPVVFDLDKDLVSLEAASRIDLKTLAEEIEAICKGLKDVEHELKPSQEDSSQMFCKNLEEFLLVAQAEVGSLTSLHSEMLENVDALAIYFGEDPAHYPFKEVFSKLFEFTKMLQRAHRENCEQLELERSQTQKERQLKDKNFPLGKKELVDLLQGPNQSIISISKTE